MDRSGRGGPPPRAAFMRGNTPQSIFKNDYWEIFFLGHSHKRSKKKLGFQGFRMCSISGIIATGTQLSREQLERTLETMNSSMRHRGPDDQGIQIDARADGIVGLANTRLAIIDPSAGGHQPMHDSEAGVTLT